MSNLVAHISAVGALGRAIDGTTPPLSRRKRAPSNDLNGEMQTTWKCLACGRVTDDAADQARHIAHELRNATTAGQVILCQECGALFPLHEWLKFPNTHPMCSSCWDENHRRNGRKFRYIEHYEATLKAILGDEYNPNRATLAIR